MPMFLRRLFNVAPGVTHCAAPPRPRYGAALPGCAHGRFYPFGGRSQFRASRMSRFGDIRAKYRATQLLSPFPTR
jgi:hypothetical protein